MNWNDYRKVIINNLVYRLMSVFLMPERLKYTNMGQRPM